MDINRKGNRVAHPICAPCIYMFEDGIVFEFKTIGKLSPLDNMR